MPYLELHTTTTTATIDWKLLRAPVLFRGIMDAYVPLMEEKGVQRGDTEETKSSL